MYLRKALLISLSFFLIENNASAYEVKVLERGEPAPFRGLIFTESSAKKLQNELELYDKTKKINESLNRSIDLYKKNESLFEQDLKKLKDQNKSLEEAVVRAKDNSWLEKAGYLVLGAVASGLVVYGATR